MREAIKGVLKYHQRPSLDREDEHHLMREAIKGVLKYQRPSEDREDERHLEAPERVREHYPLQIACAFLAQPVLSEFPQWRQPVEVDGAQPIARCTHAHHEQGIHAPG